MIPPSYLSPLIHAVGRSEAVTRVAGERPRRGVGMGRVGDKVGCGRGTQGDDDKSPSPKVSGDL